MSAPWMKFYPRDWRGDQALRAVSIAARGLWMECICIMHEARPYGHLVLNGQPIETDVLARMTGAPVDEVSALLAELRQAGVLSVTGKGVVFSRRMTKDQARSQKGRKAVEKRWRQEPDKQAISGEPNRSANSIPTTQKPEARDQKEEEEPPVTPLAKPKPSEPRGARLHENWFPPHWTDGFALKAGLPLDAVNVEADKFRDYWRAAAGARGRKLDWDAVWRTWIRNAVEYRNKHGPQDRKQTGSPLMEAFDELDERIRDAGFATH